MKAKSEGKTFAGVKTALFILLAGILICGCNNNHYPKFQISYKEGKIFRQGDDHPFTGRILDTLDYRILEYDVKDGLKDGEFYLTTLTGKPLIRGFIENNKNNGPWIYLYLNGNKESEGFFKNDQPHGKWFWYHPDGSIKAEGYYIDGKEQGNWRNYDDQGSLTRVTHYDSGKKMSEVILNKPKSI